jgi:hypothetical protein
MKRILLALALNILLIVSLSAAKMETVNLGPFTAEFDLGNSEDQITVNSPDQADDHNTYSFRVDSKNAGEYHDVYIDDYGTLVDASQSRLMNEIKKTVGTISKLDWKPTASVCGLPAVMCKETYNDGSGFSYDTAYSPDGVGDKGSIIATIYSCQCPEETANKFVSQFKVKRAQ